MLRNDSSNSIIELQHKLMEAQRKYGDKIRPYTASVRCQKDIESLSKIGLNPKDISRSLDLSISFVRSHLARINEDKVKRMRFLSTGILPEPDVDNLFGISYPNFIFNTA